jgi:GMP synthase-like glutamine amidotransferase
MMKETGMRALVLQHIAVEGPGRLGPFLEQRGWALDTRALYAEDGLPAEPQDYHAIIIMGGPMGVYDEAVYPFLHQEHAFLQRAITQQVPLLGICLGSQLLAKALGARVYPNACKEIGWYTVDLTAAGRADLLFQGVPASVPVFQWHGDAFELPAGAVALASSPQCTHQAFRYGERVYGLLFHLELVPAMIHSWLATFQEELAGVQACIDPQRIVTEIPQYLERYQRVSTQIFTNLVDHVWTPLATGANITRNAPDGGQYAVC